jgi:single-strand DNA-binding protein
MASFNNVVLMGNVTRDIELRYTTGGTAVTDMGLAVNNRVKKNGDWIEEPMFIDVTIWGKQAELASQYLSKGRSVLVQGELRLDSWENNEGQKRSKHYINASNVTFVGPAPKQSTAEAKPEQSSTGAPDADIPF